MRILAGIGLMAVSILSVGTGLMVFMFYPSLVVAVPTFGTGIYLCCKK